MEAIFDFVQESIFNPVMPFLKWVKSPLEEVYFKIFPECQHKFKKAINSVAAIFD